MVWRDRWKMREGSLCASPGWEKEFSPVKSSRWWAGDPFHRCSFQPQLYLLLSFIKRTRCPRGMCLLPARVNVCPRVRCTDPPGEISKSNHARLLFWWMMCVDSRWFERHRARMKANKSLRGRLNDDLILRIWNEIILITVDLCSNDWFFSMFDDVW